MILQARNEVQVVKSYERVIVFRLGRLIVGSERATGLIIILPCIDTYNKIDIRTVTFDVPPQEARTIHCSLKATLTCRFCRRTA